MYNNINLKLFEIREPWSGSSVLLFFFNMLNELSTESDTLSSSLPHVRKGWQLISPTAVSEPHSATEPSRKPPDRWKKTAHNPYSWPLLHRWRSVYMPVLLNGFSTPAESRELLTMLYLASVRTGTDISILSAMNTNQLEGRSGMDGGHDIYSNICSRKVRTHLSPHANTK